MLPLRMAKSYPRLADIAGAAREIADQDDVERNGGADAGEGDREQNQQISVMLVPAKGTSSRTAASSVQMTTAQRRSPRSSDSCVSMRSLSRPRQMLAGVAMAQGMAE